MLEQKQQEKTKMKTAVYLIPIIVFIGFIFYIMIRFFTVGEVRGEVAEATDSIEGVGTLTDTFEEVLQENIYAKNQYINLNGLTTRVLGINSLNERQKLKNGYLSTMEGAANTNHAINNVIELNNFLTDRGIAFLYILAPSQNAFYGTEFAPGYESNAAENIDTVMDALDEADVSTLDMDAWFEKNGWTIEDTFFKTDHHWLPRAGFQAAKLTMESLAQRGLTTYDPETLNEDNWTVTVYENWFLGSHGKRTGIPYAGVDDFSVYVPNFTTDYNYAYLQSDTTDWTYTDSPLFPEYMENKDYFSYSDNDVYLQGDYPLREITNSEAQSDKTILILGDSFRRPYEYFLSTQFQEVYGMDLRHYTDGTLAQYIMELKPDIVVMCSCTYNLPNISLYTFDVSSYLEELEKTDADEDSLELGGFSIEAKEKGENNYTLICSGLEPGQSYTLTVDSTAYSDGEDRYIQLTLQDLSSDEAVYNRYFEANQDETQRWIFTVPEDVEDEYGIYFYAGTRGHTAGVSAGLQGVTLRKGVYEE